MSMLLCSSQDEQYFVNAQLPDLHQVDVPDVWIGISGITHFCLRQEWVVIKGKIYHKGVDKITETSH